MPSIKEVAEQAEELNEQLYQFAHRAFAQALAAGVVLTEQRDEDSGEYIFLPTKCDYKFDGYETDSKGMEIKGKVYTGCGEYDHTRIHIPFEHLDNVEAWIALKKAEIDAAAQKRGAAKQAKEAQEKLEQEQAEREHYQALKVKYEGAQ